jgi:hypothetical protein
MMRATQAGNCFTGPAPRAVGTRWSKAPQKSPNWGHGEYRLQWYD